MAMWNPWRGCHRCSEGCRYCYIHKGDLKRGVNTNDIVRCDGFDAPIARYLRGEHKGEYKMKSGERVYLCFSSDFLLEEADSWRGECWKIMRERSDLNFLFLTKRIERFADCIPEDWGEGYENVTLGCTVENQATVDSRLAIFDALPIKHKNIICQPLIERVTLNGHLLDIEQVVVGGESDPNARVLDLDWVLSIREECLQSGIHFEFRQTGSKFMKDGQLYEINVRQQAAQARKANLNI